MLWGDFPETQKCIDFSVYAGIVRAALRYQKHKHFELLELLTKPEVLDRLRANHDRLSDFCERARKESLRRDEGKAA